MDRVMVTTSCDAVGIPSKLITSDSCGTTPLLWRGWTKEARDDDQSGLRNVSRLLHHLVSSNENNLIARTTTLYSLARLKKDRPEKLVSVFTITIHRAFCIARRRQLLLILAAASPLRVNSWVVPSSHLIKDLSLVFRNPYSRLSGGYRMRRAMQTPKSPRRMTESDDSSVGSNNMDSNDAFEMIRAELQLEEDKDNKLGDPTDGTGITHPGNAEQHPSDTALDPKAKAKAERKTAKKAMKAARRAQREGRGDPTAGQKPCDMCGKSVDLLVRCTYDASGEWKMVCGKCWNIASGGVIDGDAEHEHYRYGGLWKNRRKR